MNTKIIVLIVAVLIVVVGLISWFRIKSKYSQILTDNKGTYIGVNLSGGLGNHLFQLASTIGIAKHNKATPCYTASNKAEDLVDIDIQRCPAIDFATQTENGYAIYTPFGIKISTKVGSYLQSFKYTTEQFKVNDAMNLFAKTYLKPLNKAVTRVGIHVRRGDHISLGYLRFPPDQYFKNAMQYFRAKYGDIQFVVSSNDVEWCKKQSFFDEAHIITENHSSIQDMAILSNCDHVIVSIGTFGWWSATMSKGDVVYYVNEFDMEHKTNKDNVNPDDYFPTEWIGMSDT